MGRRPPHGAGQVPRLRDPRRRGDHRGRPGDRDPTGDRRPSRTRQGLHRPCRRATALRPARRGGHRPALDGPRTGSGRRLPDHHRQRGARPGAPRHRRRPGHRRRPAGPRGPPAVRHPRRARRPPPRLRHRPPRRAGLAPRGAVPAGDRPPRRRLRLLQPQHPDGHSDRGCDRPQPRYQIIEFLRGELLDTIAPRGTRVPGHVLDDVSELFGQLGLVPRDDLPSLSAGWPDDGRTADFARRLSAVTAGVHVRFLPEFGDLYARFGIPADALTAIEQRWVTLRPRPFRLLHTDIHRKNIIVSGGRGYFLDWELALWGDPVYDLAVHLHKMSYQPDESAAVVTGWSTVVGGAAAEGWQPDLDTYLAHERVKSAIVDTVRHTKIIADGNLTPDGRNSFIDKLVGKLAAAHIQQWIDRRG
ncbi:phosphotransferase [Frankia tisae]|uniref:phosphotransferase n=1 Tax=Frankia tisae TaxID=2950104 RepID=UPI0021C17248|nr:phosphotransferase [Frankia tisae]